MGYDIAMENSFRAGGDATSVDFGLKRDRLVLPGQVISEIAFTTSAFEVYGLKAVQGHRIQDMFEMIMITLKQLTAYMEVGRDGFVQIMDGLFYCLTLELETSDDAISQDGAEDNKLRRNFHTLFTALGKYMEIKDREGKQINFVTDSTEDMVFVEKVANILAGRRFCITHPSNRMGLVPVHAGVGDSVAIFRGAPFPFVIRHVSKEDGFSLVGDAYILGVMRGECAVKETGAWNSITLI